MSTIAFQQRLHMGSHTFWCVGAPHRVRPVTQHEMIEHWHWGRDIAMEKLRCRMAMTAAPGC